MTREDRMQAAAVDRYWDALALTGRPPETDPPDRETAALIQRLWVLGTPPDPEVARERVWERVQQRAQEAHDMDAQTLATMARLTSWGPRNPNGAITPRPSAISGHPWWRGTLGQVAAAALLLLALGGSLISAGLLRPPGGANQPAYLPAVILAPATPTPAAATEETLLEITIPAEALPQGARLATIFDHATSPAGSTGTWQAINSAGQPGLRIHYVLDGSLIIRAADATQVVRAGAGGLPEAVPTGTEVTLGTGDAWIARNETVFEAVNPSEVPADLLVWVVANLEDPAGVLNYPLPSNWVENTFVHDQPGPGAPGVALPAGPVTLRLRRVELPVKGRLPAPADGLQYGLTAPTNAAGTPVVGPAVGNQPDGDLVNIGRKPATVYVLNVEPAGAGPAASPAGTPTS